MRQRFTVIEGGAGVSSPLDVAGGATGPVSWRVDLRRAVAVSAAEIAAWRALLVRSAAADPVRADPDYLLSAAQHQAGGRDIVFALAWATGAGPDLLSAVVPLVLPHTLFGSGRIVPWHPSGLAVAPTFAADTAPAVCEALGERLRALRPRSILALDAESPARNVASPARFRTVPRRGSIPAHSLVGVRPLHALGPAEVERISEPERVRDAVEAFLLLDAEVSDAPIIGDPSEAAMVRVVTRLFAERRQVTVTLTRRADTVIAATLTLGAGAAAIVWRHVDAGSAPERIERLA